MKKITLIAAIVMIAFTTNSFAQDNASVATSATVITPIAIAPGVELNFGDIVGTAAGGTVTISADGTTRTPSDPNLIIGQQSGFTAATFAVTGEASYTYAITLPADFSVTNGIEVGSPTMVVSGFATTPGATGTLSTEGAQTVTVGAMITLAASQPSGVYTNADGLNIAVQYN